MNMKNETMSPIPQNRIEQELHLTFRYAVHFTEGVFSSAI